MADFDDIIKSTQLHQGIQKSLGLSSQFTQMMKAQENMIMSLSGINMEIELVKSIQEHQKIFDNLTQSAMDAMNKSLSIQTKFTIPPTILDAISSTNIQNEQFFSNLKTIIEANNKSQTAFNRQILNLRSITEQFNKSQVAFEHNSNWQIAFSGIAVQLAAIATIAVNQKKWDLIDDLEEVTGQALEFSENLTGEITEEQKRQFQILLTIIFTFINKHKQKGINAFKCLEVILVFYSCYSILFPKSEFANKEDIRQINLKQDTLNYKFNLVYQQLNVDKVFRNTRRLCKVMSKPRLKSIIIEKLSADFKVNIVQVNHKWVYVTYFSPADNLPQTGWVMKKYLMKSRN